MTSSRRCLTLLFKVVGDGEQVLDGVLSRVERGATASIAMHTEHKLSCTLDANVTGGQRMDNPLAGRA